MTDIDWTAWRAHSDFIAAWNARRAKERASTGGDGSERRGQTTPLVRLAAVPDRRRSTPRRKRNSTRR